MIVPDVNLLIYAYSSGALHHETAKAWWEGLLNGQEPVGLPWIVLHGFIRLMTNPRVLESPFGMPTALDIVGSWISRPRVLTLSPGSRHLEIMGQLFRSSGGGSSLTTDAAIASIALEHRAVIHSNDVDFLRFEGLELVNPLKGGRDPRSRAP